MKPYGNNILFKPFKGDATSEHGIIVPDSIVGESDKGLIVSVGQGTKIRPMKLKENTIGFRVHQWGRLIEENGEKYYLMEDKAIIALE